MKSLMLVFVTYKIRHASKNANLKIRYPIYLHIDLRENRVHNATSVFPKRADQKTQDKYYQVIIFNIRKRNGKKG